MTAFLKRTLDFLHFFLSICDQNVNGKIWRKYENGRQTNPFGPRFQIINRIWDIQTVFSIDRANLIWEFFKESAILPRDCSNSFRCPNVASFFVQFFGCWLQTCFLCLFSPNREHWEIEQSGSTVTTSLCHTQNKNMSNPTDLCFIFEHIMYSIASSFFEFTKSE